MNKKILLYICLVFILVVLLLIACLQYKNKIDDNYYKSNNSQKDLIKSIELNDTLDKLDNDYVKNQVIISFDKNASINEIDDTLDSINDLKESSSLFDNAVSNKSKW